MEDSNAPFFSIIVPVYNVEKYIKDCLESVLSQTFSSYEILCIDDGSTDDSGHICDEYSKKYCSIKTFHKKNEGLGLTRNYGIDRAAGKYIYFIDSDDFIPHCDCLKKIQKALSERNVQLLNINHCTCSFETGMIDKSNPRFSDEHDSNYYFNNNCFTPSACFKIVERQFVIKEKIYFQKGISEDFLWTAKILNKNPSMSYLFDDYYYCYRNYRAGSLTQSKNLKYIDTWTNILREIKHINDNNTSELLLLYSAKSFFGIFLTVAKKYSLEDVLNYDFLQFYNENCFVMKDKRIKKSYILYHLINKFGSKNTIRLIKMIKK